MVRTCVAVELLRVERATGVLGSLGRVEAGRLGVVLTVIGSGVGVPGAVFASLDALDTLEFVDGV
jgi:hypothetical protein